MAKVKQSWLDKVAKSVSPQWGAKRIHNKLKYEAMAGYVIPGSAKKSMKGFVASALSPDRDMIPKLRGTRAISRDMAMNAPLAVSILRRSKVNVVGSGLQLQANIDRDILKITEEKAAEWERVAESEFDMWADSFSSDFDGINLFNEQQALLVYNMFLSGDVFFILPWKKNDELPYELCVKLIDADLVRDPNIINTGDTPKGADIKGGVEKDENGTVVAFHVHTNYEFEYNVNNQAKSIRIPVFDSNKRRQIFHFMDSERIGQRRGIALLAPVADSLKQLTRLSEAELMSALVSSFFTVFIKDMSGLDALMQQGYTPQESITGGGGGGPLVGPTEPKTAGNEYDIEMGPGAINYLDDKKEIQVADPRKTDQSFKEFYEALAKQVSAAANIPVEQVLMQFTTSYTSAKAALNESVKFWAVERNRISKRFCKFVYTEFLTEAILKGRINAPGFFDDPLIKRAWTNSRWIGPGEGYLNPLQEIKASVIAVNSKLSTREDEYMGKRGARWDQAMHRYAREQELLESLGIDNQPNSEELLGADGQQNEK